MKRSGPLGPNTPGSVSDMSLAISRILLVVGSIIEWSIDLAHGFECGS